MQNFLELMESLQENVGLVHYNAHQFRHVILHIHKLLLNQQHRSHLLKDK